MLKAWMLPTLLTVTTACSRPERAVENPPAADDRPEAPWRSDVLGGTAVPPVFLAEWRTAENRDSCAPIAFAAGALETTAKPRAAPFSGGWGVAYDLPDLRGAFGVAGTGVNASDPSYDDWPHTRSWSDGSTAGYGPEGGTGPNHLAYLRIEGQGCLYNVWSRHGLPHLESLLNAIRLIDTRSG